MIGKTGTNVGISKKQGSMTWTFEKWHIPTGMSILYLKREREGDLRVLKH